jgi:hypothetical protein
VCGTCDCKEPDRTGTDARNWDGYLK